MIEGVIYRYKSPSNKYYIGQTIDEYSRRRHFLMNGSNYSGPKIENARKKYGPENFEYKVLMKVTGDNEEEVKQYLNTLEIGFIRIYDSYKNGYNSTEGGGGIIGMKHSEETKRKIGIASSKRRYSDETKKKHYEYHIGRKLSDETKKKISDSNKGRKLSDETKKKISDSNKGKKYSEEIKLKMSISRKGKKRGPYIKKKDNTKYPLW